jgi:hypothetical protein
MRHALNFFRIPLFLISPFPHTESEEHSICEQKKRLVSSLRNLRVFCASAVKAAFRRSCFMGL